MPVARTELLTTSYLKVVVAAKTTSNASKTTPFPPDPNSPQSTINTVEREIREAGGEATAIRVDTTDPTSINELVRKTIEASLLFLFFPSHFLSTFTLCLMSQSKSTNM